MVVYQAAMEQQPREEMMQEEIEFNPQMAAHGGRIGLANGGVPGSQFVDTQHRWQLKVESDGSESRWHGKRL